LDTALERHEAAAGGTLATSVGRGTGSGIGVCGRDDDERVEWIVYRGGNIDGAGLDEGVRCREGEEIVRRCGSSSSRLEGVPGGSNLGYRRLTVYVPNCACTSGALRTAGYMAGIVLRTDGIGPAAKSWGIEIHASVIASCAGILALHKLQDMLNDGVVVQNRVGFMKERFDEFGE